MFQNEQIFFLPALLFKSSLPLYPQGKSAQYLLYRRLGGPQIQFRHYGGEKKMSCHYQESNPNSSVIQSVA
jgi:hypothetical protein